MVTLSPAYSITIKVGEMLFAGHVDNSLAIVPNYEPILRKTLGGRFDLDFVGVDLDMQVSGLTYERTTAEAATHYDFAALRAACNSSASVTFVYGDITPGKVVLTGNAKLTDYQETAGSGKISGQWSCRLRSVRGSVQEEVVPPEVQDVKYGLLYNYYAVDDPRNITVSGWSVPTEAQFNETVEYLGGASVAGRALKEDGTTYWASDNADNSSRFNARGAGQRDWSAGVFQMILNRSNFWLKIRKVGILVHDTIEVTTPPGLAFRQYGFSIRPVRDSTILTDGQTGVYIGNDGRVYRTIAIGNPAQEWLADNLAETKFRDGESIPEVTNNAAWAALTTAGMCAYNNDWSNV